MKRLLYALILFSLGSSAAPADQDSDLVAATVVVYNRQAPDSVALAYFYAKARQISFDHLVGLECSNEEEISREEYNQTIAERSGKSSRTETGGCCRRMASCRCAGAGSTSSH
jgi:hypothetical protein